jgi:hypothetical protein
MGSSFFPENGKNERKNAVKTHLTETQFYLTETQLDFYKKFYILSVKSQLRLS